MKAPSPGKSEKNSLGNFFFPTLIQNFITAKNFVRAKYDISLKKLVGNENYVQVWNSVARVSWLSYKTDEQKRGQP